MKNFRSNKADLGKTKFALQLLFMLLAFVIVSGNIADGFGFNENLFSMELTEQGEKEEKKEGEETDEFLHFPNQYILQKPFAYISSKDGLCGWMLFFEDIPTPPPERV